ncbi:MAG TPA: ABC transporter permease [Thermoanaerobaculia bacterium]|nr:ABC transporter permease [Thermoanaerobaculia bacterium]
MIGQQDLSYSLRLAVRSPLFTLVVVLTLALGIGATTSIFTVVDAALLRPVPYPDPERIVVVLGARPERGPERISLAPADFLALRAYNRSFSQLGAFVPGGSVDLVEGGEPVQLQRHLVSAGVLEALGVHAVAGRLFQADDYRQGHAAILSHRLWRNRFAGDARVVGRELLLGGERTRVLGVLPADFRIPGGDPDVILPLTFKPADSTDRSSAYLGGIGRLRRGVSLAQARADLGNLAHDLAQRFPATNRGLEMSLVPLPESFGMQARTALWAIFGAVAFVLLMTCVNVSNLHLMRSLAREHELGIRAALGATTSRLVRQLLTENLLLALAGGALGLLLARLALRLMPDPRGVYLPSSLGVGLGARAFGFTVLVTLASAVISGLLPAWRASSLRRPISGERGGTAGPRHERLQRGLVALEMGVAFMLLLGSGLLIRSFVAILDQDLGFDPGQVLTFDVSLPASRYGEPQSSQQFYRDLVRKLEDLPQVEAVGAAKEIPPEEPWTFHPGIEGEEVPKSVSVGWQLIIPGYFEALRTTLLAGQPLTDRDRSGSRRVALLNQRAVRTILGSGAAVGRRLRFNGEYFDVVGVVEDQRDPGGEAVPVVYFAYFQTRVPADLMRSMSFVVRSRASPRVVAGLVRSAVRSLDRSLPISRLTSMEERLSMAAPLVRSRFNALLMAVFAGLALLLAAVGIYGVISYSVRQRTREIGVRMALGARRADLVSMVLRRGLAVALLGVGCGALGSAALARVLASLLFGTGSADPLTFVAISIILFAVAALACYVPARRASRLDPAVALRAQ